MSNPEHFDSRAAAYRQLALNSSDPRLAGDMFEIASMFGSMANDLRLLRQARPKCQTHGTRILARLAWLRLERPHPLAIQLPALITPAGEASAPAV